MLIKKSLVWLLVLLLPIVSCTSFDINQALGTNVFGQSTQGSIPAYGSKKNADQGRMVFENFKVGSTKYSYYRPGTQSARKIDKQFKSLLNNYQRTQDIPTKERIQGLKNLAKVMNYLERQKAKKTGGTLIKPRSKVKFKLRTYCLDSNLPAPKRGEKMHLIADTQMFPADLSPVYDDILRHASKTRQYSPVQGIVWNLRNLRKNSNIQFSQSQRSYIAAASPSALSRIDAYLATAKAKGFLIDQLDKLLQKKTGHTLSGIQNKVQGTFGSVQEVSNRLQDLEKLAVSGQIPRDNSEYTLLREAVAAKIISPGGARTLNIEIANNSDYPYAFAPTDFAAKSERKVQHLGLQPGKMGDSYGLGSFLSEKLGQVADLLIGEDLKNALLGNDFDLTGAAIDTLLLVIPAGVVGKVIVKVGKGAKVKKGSTLSVDDILKGSRPGRKTKGKTNQVIKDGGFKQANKDFDALSPTKVKDINTKFGTGRTGELSDGTRVTVRPGSSDGRPTLEIRNPANSRGTEVRFED